MSYDRKRLAKKIARRFSYKKKKEAKRKDRVKTAGEVRFVKDRGPEEFQRQIPDDPDAFDWDEEVLPELSRILWGLSCALGHLHSSYTKFTKLKASNYSPDGKLGGQGYVQNISDMRADLAESMESISDCVDTLDDEVNAPHWKEDELSKEEQEEIAENVEDAQEIAGDPEEFAEEQYEEEIENEIEQEE